jgi:formylglycine-generating enzyme required for sulfatase activity
MAGASRAEDDRNASPFNMVFVEGGTFRMGDVFGDGKEDERPVHEVTLTDFYLAKYEVTVGEFKVFIKETEYKTSAESPENWEEQEKIIDKFIAGTVPEQDREKLYTRLISYSGTGIWYTDTPRWGFEHDKNWQDPGFEQTDNDPVVSVSWNDAIHYCNWLSEKGGFPVAYDLESGRLLDGKGDPTFDITDVKGYRLPTEAEWEYAAREGGRKLRFGNGKNIARSSEINFRADAGECSYLEPGDYRKGTVPVGSLVPNDLGLYEMSGNAWEWVSDKYATYKHEIQVNPYNTKGSKRTLRGGRWGGKASSIRVFYRSAYAGNDRCNNSGFRIAMSK